MAQQANMLWPHITNNDQEDENSINNQPTIIGTPVPKRDNGDSAATAFAFPDLIAQAQQQQEAEGFGAAAQLQNQPNMFGFDEVSPIDDGSNDNGFSSLLTANNGNNQITGNSFFNAESLNASFFTSTAQSFLSNTNNDDTRQQQQQQVQSKTGSNNNNNGLFVVAVPNADACKQWQCNAQVLNACVALLQQNEVGHLQSSFAIQVFITVRLTLTVLHCFGLCVYFLAPFVLIIVIVIVFCNFINVFA